VVATGWYYGSVDFGGGSLKTAGDSEIFLAKFDTNGNHLWSKGFGGMYGDEDKKSVACDGSGNVIVTGYYFGTVDFGGGPLTSAGVSDIYLAKFDADGNHLWSKRFGDATCQGGHSVACDGSGNIVATGLLGGTVDFGGGPLTSSGSDVFLVKFGP
jgi:hypothetical protein